MPVQRVPRQPGLASARPVRYRRLPVPDVSTGGGGTGLLEVGPSFGQSAGDDPSTLDVGVGIELLPYGLIFDLEAGVAIALADVDLVNSQLGVGSAVDLERIGLIFQQLNVGAAVDLAALSARADLDVGVAIGGKLATSRALGVGAAVALPSLRPSAALGVGVRLDASLVIDSLDTGVGAAVDLASLRLSTPLGVGSAVFLSEMELIDYLDWANANVTTTSWTNPNLAIDKDIATVATATAAATGIGGVTNTTINPNLVSSFPDFAAPFTDFTLDSVVWEYRWRTFSSGTQVVAGTVNMNVRYSVNDGGSYTVQENVSAVASDPGAKSVDLTAIANTWTKITQFRTQVDGTITSGTGLGKAQTMEWYFSRLRIQAHRTF